MTWSLRGCKVSRAVAPSAVPSPGFPFGRRHFKDALFEQNKVADDNPRFGGRNDIHARRIGNESHDCSWALNHESLRHAMCFGMHEVAHTADKNDANTIRMRELISYPLMDIMTIRNLFTRQTYHTEVPRAEPTPSA
jgi:hypothetical protein